MRYRLSSAVWIVISMMMPVVMGAQTSGTVAENALKFQAFWIDRSTILIPASQGRSDGIYKLFSDPSAKIGFSTKGLAGHYSVALHSGEALRVDQIQRFPQLSHGYLALTLPSGMTQAIEHVLLKGQLSVSVQKPDGTLTYATGVQIAGVLDDLYAYSGTLGVVVRDKSKATDEAWSDFPDSEDGTIKVKVWAPTAQSMQVELFETADQSAPGQVVPMQEHNGVWVAVLDQRWLGKYYLFDEKVYAPSKLAVVEHLVTDPYSIDLAINGTKSRILDINGAEAKPAGWDADASPPLERWSDLSIYELHIRDFSVADTTVRERYRGTYLAFTETQSEGMKHLQGIASAGMRAVHLLPSFHFGSVNEDKTTWKQTADLAVDSPASKEQQAAVSAIKSQDAYNWGYDPVHYMAPAGAYAVDPDSRVKEYRSMVMALHHTGLRVIQDVVFNHTSGFGEDANSVLDKVVPSYYNRLDADGKLLTATCCADTATEHVMMGKLQQDAIVWNAKHYKIDGFRFDLMGFTFINNLRQIRSELNKLTLAKDGIDGSKIYIYGEGWEFGETSNAALGENASQLHLFGTGVGSFNDRLRDGVRGGSVTGDPLTQGFATGLLTDSSRYTQGRLSTKEQRRTLLHQEDLVRVGLAGNLRDYHFIDSTGAVVTGKNVLYGSQPAGYAATPSETVNYVSAHDNQILFDIIQLKSAVTDDTEMRARRQVLAMSIVALGEGIPFVVGGDDMLRSKDMDGNSYNSGDWFNKIIWNGRTNNWGIGLPMSDEGGAEWIAERPLLEKPDLVPTPSEISRTSVLFQEFLKIRYSSGLFRLSTADEVQKNVRFWNADIPGTIVMELGSDAEDYGAYGRVIVIFNATLTAQTFHPDDLGGTKFELHPIQKTSADPTLAMAKFNGETATFDVPALTTSVFVSVK